MTREQIIKIIEEVQDCLTKKVGADELTDYTREQAWLSLETAIDFLQENAE